MKHPWLVLVLMATSMLALAQPAVCQETTTQAQMNTSANQGLSEADAALRKFYDTYVKRLDPEQAKLFKAANSQCAKFQKAYCQFEASGSVGGSVYPMAFASCMSSQAEKRLKELRQLSRCHEGDSNCPAWLSATPNNSSKRTRIPRAA